MTPEELDALDAGRLLEITESSDLFPTWQEPDGVRRAYLRLARRFRPEREPRAFAHLRALYEARIAGADCSAPGSGDRSASTDELAPPALTDPFAWTPDALEALDDASADRIAGWLRDADALLVVDAERAVAFQDAAHLALEVRALEGRVSPAWATAARASSLDDAVDALRPLSVWPLEQLRTEARLLRDEAPGLYRALTKLRWDVRGALRDPAAVDEDPLFQRLIGTHPSQHAWSVVLLSAAAVALAVLMNLDQPDWSRLPKHLAVLLVVAFVVTGVWMAHQRSTRWRRNVISTPRAARSLVRVAHATARVPEELAGLVNQRAPASGSAYGPAHPATALELDLALWVASIPGWRGRLG